ncbi:MAG: sulfotransferase [Gammaproteobacteria bacterium]|nr:sulfotransferase [Gammaproteobacteria bacterium]
MNQEALQIKKQKAWRRMEKGDHSEAISILQKVIKSQPKDAEALYLLGCCQANRYLWKEAINSLESSIKIQPNVPQSHFALAGARIALGQLDDALNSLDTTLKLNPGLADAYVALGNIRIKQDNFIDAREHFNQALKIDSGSSDAYLGLGLLDQEAGDHKEAVVQLEKSLKYNSKSITTLCALANSLANLTKKNEAKALYRKALKIDKNCVEAQCSLAMIHNFNAEYDKAIKLIDPLLKKKILHPTLGIAFAQSCKHSDRCQEAIDYIDAILKKPGLSRFEVKGLNFAAGKILDGMKQYDSAFTHYKNGNEAISYLYESVANKQYIDDIMKTFTTALLMNTPVAKSEGKHPIFIVGMPRSGTSLTEQILAAHPNVFAAGELATLFNISCQMKQDLGGEKPFPFYIEKLNQDNVDEMANAYLEELSNRSGLEEYVTDKMPHNFYLVGLIQLLFPGARVIHCRRDPMDTCLSIYFQDFSEVHKYAKDLFNIGTHYNQYQRLMDHWKQVLSIPILDIHYEELVSDQETVTRRLLEFCGLEWDKNCLQFHSIKRTIDTASVDQVRQPLYTKSVKRWKNYEKYIDELKKGLEREF